MLRIKLVYGIMTSSIMVISEIWLYFTYEYNRYMSICYNNNLEHTRTDDRGVNSSVFPATDWLTSDQSLFTIRQTSYHVQNVLVTFRLQTWQPPNNHRSHSDWLVLKTCVRLNLRLIADETLIDWCAALPVPHRSNSDDDLIKGRRITDLIVLSSVARQHHMGVWQVRGRWVIGINGRCSAQSVGKPSLAGNVIGAKIRWRISNPLNFCHRTILLDWNSSVWANAHGTLVGGWAELICGWQATNRSMAGSYKSAFRSVSGHPVASVEGGISE